MIENNRMDHGIISALTVLYLIDLMYDKNNPGRKYDSVYKEGSDWNQKYKLDYS